MQAWHSRLASFTACWRFLSRLQHNSRRSWDVHYVFTTAQWSTIIGREKMLFTGKSVCLHYTYVCHTHFTTIEHIRGINEGHRYKL